MCNIQNVCMMIIIGPWDRQAECLGPPGINYATGLISVICDALLPGSLIYHKISNCPAILSDEW